MSDTSNDIMTNVGTMLVEGSDALARAEADKVVLAQQITDLEIRNTTQRERIEALVNELTVARQDTQRANERHESDIEKIGEALIDEANSRGWCDEYDTFVNRLNSDLHVELPHRASEYTVTYTYEVTVYQTVSARNSDEARDMVEDDISWSRALSGTAWTHARDEVQEVDVEQD